MRINERVALRGWIDGEMVDGDILDKAIKSLVAHQNELVGLIEADNLHDMTTKILEIGRI